MDCAKTAHSMFIINIMHTSFRLATLLINAIDHCRLPLVRRTEMLLSNWERALNASSLWMETPRTPPSLSPTRRPSLNVTLSVSLPSRTCVEWGLVWAAGTGTSCSAALLPLSSPGLLIRSEWEPSHRLRSTLWDLMLDAPLVSGEKIDTVNLEIFV